MTNNPITHSPNKLKIGIFCTNGRGTAQHTLVPEANQQDWPLSLLAARAVDEAGYEAIVPFARWKGYLKDRPDHVSAYALDPFTWAAGIAQATRRAGIFVPSHAASMHPDRKSVVSGKSVSVRVDLGGCRSIQKKKQEQH